MKIDNTPPLPASQIGELAPRSSNAKPSGGSDSSTGVNQGTSVNLGATAAHMRTLEKNIASTPAVNDAKVAEIKQAISEGRFQVNSGAVADSLINTVKDLINTNQR